MPKILTQQQIDQFWKDGCAFPIRVMSADDAIEIRRRLVAHGATDGFVTDFGRAHSVFFVDPDGLEGEVLLWLSREAEVHPPGTPATGYDPV